MQSQGIQSWIHRIVNTGRIMPYAKTLPKLGPNSPMFLQVRPQSLPPTLPPGSTPLVKPPSSSARVHCLISPANFGGHRVAAPRKRGDRRPEEFLRGERDRRPAEGWAVRPETLEMAGDWREVEQFLGGQDAIHGGGGRSYPEHWMGRSHTTTT